MRRAFGRGSGAKNAPNFKNYVLNHEWMKKKNQSRQIQFYDHYHYPDYTPHYRQFNIHGNECRIIGSVPFDNSSAQVVLSVMEECSPNVAILGERNRNDYEEMRKQKEKFLEEPTLYEGNENLFAKKLYTKFFKNQMKDDLFYYLNEADDTIYLADKINKRVLVDDYITAAYSVHKSKDTGLLFGRPETTLHLEDIALRFSLSELQNIFFKSIETTQSRFKDHNAYPFTDNQVIMTTLREVTKEQNKDTLYGKALVYQASLLKQCSRIYKKSLLITNNLFPEQIEQLTLEPALPEISEIFRTYLHSGIRGKDLSADIDETWKKDLDKDKIREILEMSKSRFNFRKEKALYENIGNLNPEEVMEKFVILNHLIDNEMRLFLIEGHNPIKNTIFADLFKDLSQDQLFGLYMSINMKYSMVLHDLQNSEINRIATYTGLAGRRKLHTYNEAIQEVDERKEKLGYQFKTGLIQAAKQSVMVNHLIMKQIQKNIQRRAAEGRNQTETLLHLQKVKEGSANPRDYEVFKELMVEANAQLKLLKLPPTYRKYMSFIKEININTMESMVQKSLGEITEEMVEAEMPFRKTVPTDVVNTSTTKKINEKQRSNLINKLSQLKEDENAVKRRQMFEKILPKDPNTKQKLSTESLINSMILGDDKPFPFDINKMSIEELREHGAEILTDFNLKMKPEGGFELVGADEDQKEKMRKLGEIIREVNEDNEADRWSDDEDEFHKKNIKY